jgi:hypothetical protein
MERGGNFPLRVAERTSCVDHACRIDPAPCDRMDRAARGHPLAGGGTGPGGPRRAQRHSDRAAHPPRRLAALRALAGSFIPSQRPFSSIPAALGFDRHFGTRSSAHAAQAGLAFGRCWGRCRLGMGAVAPFCGVVSYRRNVHSPASLRLSGSIGIFWRETFGASGAGKAVAIRGQRPGFRVGGGRGGMGPVRNPSM